MVFLVLTEEGAMHHQEMRGQSGTGDGPNNNNEPQAKRKLEHELGEPGPSVKK
jgi:hypothetical protein